MFEIIRAFKKFLKEIAMKLFLIFLLLLHFFVITAGKDRAFLSTSLFFCEIFGEKAEELYTNCTFLEEVVRNLSYSPLVLYPPDYLRPLNVQNRVCEFLCQIQPLCNIYIHNTFQLVFQYFPDRFRIPETYKTISTLTLSSLQRYASYFKISHNNNTILTMEKFALSNFWLEFWKFSVIISGNACLTDSLSNCLYKVSNQNMQYHLIKIKYELPDFLQLSSHFCIYYGYGIFEEMKESFNVECDELKSFFKEFEGRVIIRCHPFIIQKEQQQPSYFYDMREELAKIAYFETDSDYYHLLDVGTSEIITFDYLLTSLQPLLLGTLFQSFGVCATHFNTESSPQYMNSIVFPTNLVLQRSHFELFPPDNHNFTSITLPYGYNNILLLNTYASVDAYQLSKGVYFKKISDVFIDSIYLEDYYDMIQLNKRIMIGTLKKEYSPSMVVQKKDFLELLSLKLKSGGLLDHYCEHFVAGCVEPFSLPLSSEKHIRKVSKRFLRFLRRKSIFNGNFRNNTRSRTASLPAYKSEELFDISHVIPLQLDSMLLGSSLYSNPLKPYYFNQTTFIRKYPSSSFYYHPTAKVAVITAIFGSYEASCKDYAKQTIETNFYCFTDNINITTSGGWIIDTIPYYLEILQDEFERGFYLSDSYINSFHHNLHPFNLAKYYKLSFHRIPVLQQYDVIIWLDGTIRITNSRFVERILQIMKEQETVNTKSESDDDERAEALRNNDQTPPSSLPSFLDQRLIVVFEHIRNRSIITELEASLQLSRYTQPVYNQRRQPVQPLVPQLQDYLNDDFRDSYWEKLFLNENRTVEDNNLFNRKQYGMWCTCFIAFNMRKTVQPALTISRSSELLIPLRNESNENSTSTTLRIQPFLDEWFHQNRLYTTEDQISFPFVVQKLGVYPYSLPEERYSIYGSYDFNSLYVKLDHGL
jgi:hypothetical protein